MSMLRFVDAVGRVGYWGAVFFTALMMVHVSADVLSKYLLNTPIEATLEMVAHYYMVAIIFLPLGYVQSENRHIAFTMVTDQLGPRLRIVVAALAATLSLFYLGALVWTGIEEAIYQTELLAAVPLTTVSLPVWPVRWLPPLGFFLMAVCLLCQTLRSFADLAAGRAPAAPQGH